MDGASNSAWKPHLQLLKQILWGARALSLGCSLSCQHRAGPSALTCVIEVPSPLVVVGLLGKHGLGNELFCLVIEVVVEIVPQQQVQEGGLPVRIMAQRGRP